MRLVFLFTLILIATQLLAQPSSIPSFPLHENDLEITRLAQPFQYFDKIGKKAGLMGYESGSFEMWVWPWKVLRNFELSFLLGTSTQPIQARDIVRTISVTPEVTTLTYTYESFAVRQHIIAPRSEPGIILLLDIHTTTPLTIVAGFLPVMQPMWPAGIGGQFTYWDDEAKAYVISEGQWRAVFLCGSPAGKQMAAPPAHMFADSPLQFKIEVKPRETDGRFLPIVIAGGQKVGMDSVKAMYNRLWKNARGYYEENHTYYQSLRSSTLRIITDNREFDLALEWGKVALDNLMVENLSLGYGMVAGFGLSGGSARPGFAWFFGGDAFINSLAINSYGAHKTVRDALAFTQKWQRQEDFPIRKKNPSDVNIDVGKMSHELSQSDGLCDWWSDYLYGYNHADTTPWYLVAMGDYVRTSGDVEFLKQSWTSVKQAYDWCVRKDSDGDGLMDLKGAGLGALEFGKLVGLYADVYTCGVWVQGIKEMIMMANLTGDNVAKKQAEEQLTKAQPALEKKFWMEDLGFYSYGATEKGEQVQELTPWPGVAMMFGLLDEQRTHRSLVKMNGADLCTDWGVRSLAHSSPLFEPTNYNYGAVWPFIASFFNLAQFRSSSPIAGYTLLQANVQHVFDNGLGVVSEVFSGDLNQKLGEAYHHQGFSTTGYILPLLRGLVGIETDALNRTISFSPKLELPGSLNIFNIRVNGGAYNLNVSPSSGPDYRLVIDAVDTPNATVIFAPTLPPGFEVTKAVLEEIPETIGPRRGVLKWEPVEVAFEDRTQPIITVNLRSRETRITLSVLDQWAHLLPQPLKLERGGANKTLRIIDVNFDRVARSTTYLVEGLSGETYDMRLSAQKIRAVSGASMDQNRVRISFDGHDPQKFLRKEITIHH